MERITQESMRELVSAAGLSLAIGIAVGWFGAGLFRGDGEPDPDASVIQDGLFAPPGTEEEESPDGIPERWIAGLAEMGMRIVPESLFGDFALFPLDRYGRVNDDARELFLFSDHEVERLNEIIREVEERLMMAELARLQIIHSSDTEMVFQIPAFPEEGELIRESLLEKLVAELGDVDGELLWEFMNAPDEAAPRPRQDWWKGFGQFEREVVFAVYGAAPSPATEFELNDILVGEPVDTPVDDSEAWLHYAEFVVVEDFLPILPDGARIPENFSLTTRVLEGGGDMEMYSEIGRYRYLISQLPEVLQGYFRE